jgi:hypothetical protein
MDSPHLPVFILFSVHRNPGFVEQLPKEMLRNIIQYLQQQIDAGKLRTRDPEHFFISLLSMCVFPFAARNLAMHMMSKSPEEYSKFLSQRKDEIMLFVKSMIKP